VNGIAVELDQIVGSQTEERDVNVICLTSLVFPAAESQIIIFLLHYYTDYLLIHWPNCSSPDFMSS